MGEVYLNDSELLNLQLDAETGVEYIATGQSPYYLQFRKLLHRLLLATKRGNDLRVFDEGGLDIGVKAGEFCVGTQVVNYAGSSGNLLADDKMAVYIYLDADGNLVTDEYTGFPDMAEAAHLRLAVVTTANGDIDSIVDRRGEHLFAVPYEAGGVAERIEAHVADDDLVQSESGSVHTNLGATGVVTLALPDGASEGTVFTFAVQEAQELRVDPGAATIRDDSGQTADKHKACSSIGACLTVVADSNGDWVVTAKNGTWTEEV